MSTEVCNIHTEGWLVFRARQTRSALPALHPYSTCPLAHNNILFREGKNIKGISQVGLVTAVYSISCSNQPDFHISISCFIRFEPAGWGLWNIDCVGCVLKRVIAVSFVIIHLRLGVRILERNVTGGDFLTQERLNKKRMDEIV